MRRDAQNSPSDPNGISGMAAVEQGSTLDPTGNWNGYVVKNSAGSPTLNQSRTQNKVNEITGISESVGSSWVDPAYDDAGNMITGPMGTTPTTKLHFVFDAWNRMVSVKADASGSPGTTIASYAYDGRNRRITKTIGGHTYHGYYNNNWQYLETRIDTATTSSGQIVWDLRYIDSPLVLLGGTNPLYYTNDANFNVTGLVNGATGAVSERSQYDPYGNVQFYTAGWATTTSSAANNPVLYCGYTFDSESGICLARNRYLNLATGTWEKRDPLSFVDSMNLYEYTAGNPIIRSDASGYYFAHLHWLISALAFIGSCIKWSDVKKAVDESVMIDFQGTQGVSWKETQQHAMAGRKDNGDFQTEEEAKEAWTNYVRELMDRAHGVDAGYICDPSSLGKALHAVEDRYALGHHFQKWDKGMFHTGIPDPLHIFGDALPLPMGGFDRALKEATALVKQYESTSCCHPEVLNVTNRGQVSDQPQEPPGYLTPAQEYELAQQRSKTAAPAR